jgi:hypothetical protein
MRHRNGESAAFGAAMAALREPELGDGLSTDLDRMRSQRDELAAVLKRISDGAVMSGEWSHADTVEAYQRLARAALAKVK